MRGREWVAGAAVVLLWVGSALPQSIGEVVERDKKRREALKGKAGKSYGDADLAARRPTPEPEPSPSPAPTGATALPSAATPAPPTAVTATPTPAPRTPAEKASASLKAPGGWEYQPLASKRFSQLQSAVQLRCMEGTPGGRATFWVHIGSGGSVAEVLYDPPSSYASCLAEALRGKDFPPPPSGSFWYSTGMQWTAP
jgi:hypothetical protein